ncbi:response regulator transcription factor [Streptomyces sp. NBC_00631]|uniref:response regulator n=1 Tax=Streptomyces sp. NBC_00631 TaxID=2975793 RepID=UPI0030E577F1
MTNASGSSASGGSSGSAIRVLIADDQEMVRTGFRLILQTQPGIEVVGESADGAECVEMARKLRPDVCLVDIRMPKLDGLEVTRLLAGPRAVDPLRVVVVTTFDQDDYVYGALSNGACGFLLKDAGPGLLVEAVRAAARGDALISPSVTVRLLKRIGEQRPAADEVSSGPLTERELDVARLVADGRTNQELCAELCVSLSTVKSHLTNIQTKLGVRNRVEIAAWAWRRGVVGDR